ERARHCGCPGFVVGDGPCPRRCLRWQGSAICLALPPYLPLPRTAAVRQVGTMSALEGSKPNEVRVVCSGAFRAAYQLLVAGFEGATGRRVVTAWGSSAAGAPTSI